MFRFFRSSHSDASWAASVAVSTVFGCAAGAVGTLLVVAFVAPAIAPASYPSAAPSAIIGSIDQGVSASGVDAAVRALAFFAPVKANAAGVGSGYVPSEAVGLGMALTSDGWIVTADAAIAAKKNPVVVIDGRAHAVTRTVRDGYTGAVFAKIEAADLPVVPFGENADMAPGDAVFAVDAAGGVAQLAVAANDTRPTGSVARSSDQLQRYLRLVGPKVLPGAMVLDRRGRVVAMVAVADDGLGSLAVPMSQVSSVVGPVLRSGGAARPVLGLEYVDLSRIASSDAVAHRGAYVSSVVAGGPAAAAGIRPGDVIVSVNDEPVSSKMNLSDLIADYVPGDRLTLVVTRGAVAELRIVVTLGPVSAAR